MPSNSTGINAQAKVVMAMDAPRPIRPVNLKRISVHDISTPSSSASTQGASPVSPTLPTGRIRPQMKERPVSLLAVMPPSPTEVRGIQDLGNIPSEYRDVVARFGRNAVRVYAEGWVSVHVVRLAHDTRKRLAQSFVLHYAVLTGTTLALYPAHHSAATGEAEVSAPVFLNLTDACESLIHDKVEENHVIALTTAGQNLYHIICPSGGEAAMWFSAIKIAGYEWAMVQEAYTSILMRGFKAPAQSVKNKAMLQGWARVRFVGETGWKKVWCALLPALTPASKSWRRRSLPTPSSVTQTHSRLALFNTKKSKEPVAILESVWAMHAIYPSTPALIKSSTLLKVLGKVTIYEPRHRAGVVEGGYILLMPEPADEPYHGAGFTIRMWLSALQRGFGVNVGSDRDEEVAVNDLAQVVEENGRGWGDRQWWTACKQLSRSGGEVSHEEILPNENGGTRRQQILAGYLSTPTKQRQPPAQRRPVSTGASPQQRLSSRSFSASEGSDLGDLFQHLPQVQRNSPKIMTPTKTPQSVQGSLVGQGHGRASDSGDESDVEGSVFAHIRKPGVPVLGSPVAGVPPQPSKAPPSPPMATVKDEESAKRAMLMGHVGSLSDEDEFLDDNGSLFSTSSKATRKVSMGEMPQLPVRQLTPIKLAASPDFDQAIRKELEGAEGLDAVFAASEGLFGDDDEGDGQCENGKKLQELGGKDTIASSFYGSDEQQGYSITAPLALLPKTRSPTQARSPPLVAAVPVEPQRTIESPLRRLSLRTNESPLLRRLSLTDQPEILSRRASQVVFSPIEEMKRSPSLESSVDSIGESIHAPLFKGAGKSVTAGKSWDAMGQERDSSSGEGNAPLSDSPKPDDRNSNHGYVSDEAEAYSKGKQRLRGPYAQASLSISDSNLFTTYQPLAMDTGYNRRVSDIAISETEEPVEQQESEVRPRGKRQVSWAQQVSSVPHPSNQQASTAVPRQQFQPQQRESSKEEEGPPEHVFDRGLLSQMSDRLTAKEREAIARETGQSLLAISPYRNGAREPEKKNPISEHGLLGRYERDKKDGRYMQAIIEAERQKMWREREERERKRREEEWQREQQKALRAAYMQLPSPMYASNQNPWGAGSAGAHYGYQSTPMTPLMMGNPGFMTPTSPHGRPLSAVVGTPPVEWPGVPYGMWPMGMPGMPGMPSPSGMQQEAPEGYVMMPMMVPVPVRSPAPGSPGVGPADVGGASTPGQQRRQTSSRAGSMR
ncbi:hypothetical protein YB2330_003306 [Saitoella coloradoensis]